MNTHADKPHENKRQSVANTVSQKQEGNKPTFQFVDNRPEAIAQRKLQEMVNNRPKGSIVPTQNNGIIQRMTDKEQEFLWKKWDMIEEKLDQIYEDNNDATLPISTELEGIRTMLGKKPEEIDKKILQSKIKRIDTWINTPAKKREGIESDRETLRLLGFPDKEAQNKILSLMSDSSGVSINLSGIEVHLDIDQLKHQPKEYPIGTRQTKAGNTFDPSNSGSIDWHISNTLVYMADWASSLGDIEEGKKMFHGQSKAVDEIHYEGFCILLDGTKYVFFHCYPANGSSMKL